ncbi:MAG: hypothetical protein WA752_25735, partial [Mycobacterium sp.]|uniref:hypothetical protein n=1 Tax=Mycobacterium sp. TaxID=1785 RepID=UPI003CB177DD
MNSESESPLDDAETAVEHSESPLGDAEVADEDPQSQNESAKASSVGESRPDRTAAIDRVASRLLQHWRS